jgi:protein gp37
MGCSGCELFPPVEKVLKEIDQAVQAATGEPYSSRKAFERLLRYHLDEMEGSERSRFEDHQKLDTVHLSHLTDEFVKSLEDKYPTEVAEAAKAAIKSSVTCYAGLDHNKKGIKVTKPGPPSNKGFAPRFLTVTQYPGRMADAASWPDLLGRQFPDKPWRDGLPRMIFVSDMGDALSSDSDLPFLKSEVLPAFTSENGKRHLWLWLTKQPARMARLSQEIEGGLPRNVCAMTTVTSRKTLPRVACLRKVNAAMRGLSIEPLWERIPPEELDLTGIDWVIVGGESGSRDYVRPFSVEWAEELREHCKANNVAFFLKQLGRNPNHKGAPLILKDSHGGNWDEWEEGLRVREFPRAFHNYRIAEEERERGTLSVSPACDFTNPKSDELVEFEELTNVVWKAVGMFTEVGMALTKIHTKKLWRTASCNSWEEYLEAWVHMSKSHAHRLMNASRMVAIIMESPLTNKSAKDYDNYYVPVSEAQVRPLTQLEDPEQVAPAWLAAIERANRFCPTAKVVQEIVDEILHPGVSEAKPPNRTQQKRELFSRLKKLVDEQESWDEVRTVLAKLEKII